MNNVMLIFLSLSLSGSILALLLLILKPFIKNKLSQTWQYYIWLIVILRFLLPLTPQVSVVGEIARYVQNTNSPTAIVEVEPNFGTNEEHAITQESPIPQNAQREMQVKPTYWRDILNNIWILWLSVALVLFVHKVASYRSFVRFVQIGTRKITDENMLNIYRAELATAKIKKQLPFYINAQVASPMLVGIIKPILIIPVLETSDDELRNILRHELTHYKRFDFLYKWIVQITLCLHWFNPLVYLISRQINKSCELSCDENVIKHLDEIDRISYGDALIKSLEAKGSYSDFVISITMSENANFVKERLEVIMTHNKPKKMSVILAIVLAVVLFVGGYALGAYTATTSNENHADQMVFSDEGLPIMSAKNREAYDAYVNPISVTGVLRRNWSPEDVSGLVEYGSDSLLTLFNALEPEIVEQSEGAIPTAIVEETLSRRFPLFPEKIRETCENIYNSSTDVYEYSGGLGGGPAVPIVTGIEENGKLMTILYTWYTSDPAADGFRYIADSSGVLIVEINGGDFQYRSNKVIEIEE